MSTQEAVRARLSDEQIIDATVDHIGAWVDSWKIKAQPGEMDMHLDAAALAAKFVLQQLRAKPSAPASVDVQLAAWRAGWDAAVYTDGDRDEALATFRARLTSQGEPTP